MDGSTFDKLTRLTAAGAGRRGVLRSGLALILAGLGATSLLDAETTSAKKKGKGGKGKGKGKNKGKKRCVGKPAGAPCKSSSECCPQRTKNICQVASNAGNSDKTCCGSVGAPCGLPDGNGDDTAPFCCVQHDCVGGFCQAVPDEL